MSGSRENETAAFTFMKQKIPLAIRPLDYAKPEPASTYRLKDASVLMLVIMLVVAVVVAIVIPKFSMRSDYPYMRPQQDIAGTASAMEAFEADNGHFPTTAEGLSSLYVAPANCPNWKGPYVARPLGNDPWGNPYIYICPGVHNPQSFDLFSMGPDGKVGRGDDVTNWSKNATSPN